MTAAVALRMVSDAPPSAIDVFVLRAWARATLYAAGVLELAEAVDDLQAAAVKDSLVDKLGQDAVQAIMRDAFHHEVCR